MYYIYALYNREYNKIYIGQTEDLEERLKLHRKKIFANSFTSRFDGDWNLIYKEIAENRKQALLREKQLKSYRGREFIKRYIPR
ncbi:MAG: GIY-YIG nuclease family protein [bacterium]|nr:GIY-YIG nuclease family protein [bacterium]